MRERGPWIPEGLRPRGGRRIAALALAIVVAGVLTPLEFADPDLVGLPKLLLVVPVALFALSGGVRGGVAGSLVLFTLNAVWHTHSATPVDLAGEMFELGAYLLVAVVIGWSVDRRRKLAARLEEHEQLSLDLIVTAGIDGYFTSVNPACTEILGYTPEEMRTTPWLDFVHPEDVESTLAEATRQIEAGEAVTRFANRYRHKDGGYRWLEWASRPDAKRTQMFAVARDITGGKEIEQARQTYTETLERAVRERTRELEEAKLETLQRLALAAEYRDDQTFEHTERVGSMAAMLAKLLELDAEQVRLMRLAAPLHDVGKLAVSDTILLKSRKLTPAEFELVKLHAAHGAAILAGSNSPVLRLAEEIARSHHEWWDGTGYPNQLRGEEIPISGRIVAVADVYDALTHDRPYKPAWPVEQAVDKIVSLGGTHFDPSVVDAFQRLDHTQLTRAAKPPRKGARLRVVA